MHHDLQAGVETPEPLENGNIRAYRRHPEKHHGIRRIGLEGRAYPPQGLLGASRRIHLVAPLRRHGRRFGLSGSLQQPAYTVSIRLPLIDHQQAPVPDG
ncbi:hypothetical protein VNPA110517_14600 [Pseudomonas aeruginosa]|nr:hypothetical protein U769_12335 [Pseudomonas aeruginosa MTB-1]GLE67627.1 hypothetical protein VNPA110517_14600 [Pseudomonas aeruginosa]GLF09795.1 hypothetical protein VNPA131183_32520 [Pseudomonas aeruginosa]